MKTPALPPTVAVRDVLYALGFIEDWHAMTEQSPAFTFNVGNLAISASEVTNISMRREFFFGGIWSRDRLQGSIEFSIPVMVESVEQAVAWIAYGIGKGFVPSRAIEWLETGKQNHHFLPWEQALQRQRDFAQQQRQLRLSRPHCLVAREWMRLVNKHLRAAAEASGENDSVVVEFDGQLLKFTLPSEVIGVPASGPAPWPVGYCVQTHRFTGLPKKFMNDLVEIGIWEGHLEVDRARMTLSLDPEKNGTAMSTRADSVPVSGEEPSTREQSVQRGDRPARLRTSSPRRKMWVPLDALDGTAHALSVIDPGGPMTYDLYRDLLRQKLDVLIQANPREARRALEMSNEHSPELWTIAANNPAQDWA
ncbi:MAG: hypothetical protein H7274_13835, partial [Rhodoferax sp.]|nr:hypothetical protein [Rhodoferax sp.]